MQFSYFFKRYSIPVYHMIITKTVAPLLSPLRYGLKRFDVNTSHFIEFLCPSVRRMIDVLSYFCLREEYNIIEFSIDVVLILE